MESNFLKNDINELTYKTDSQILKTNLIVTKGEMWVWETN